MFLWRETGYFAASADLNPLLHTWSLAVEEQFYLLYPVTLLLLFRYAKQHIVKLLVIGTLASLLLAEFASIRFASANFYLLPSRAWELGVGAIIALVQPRPAIGKTDPGGQVLSAAGVSLIFVAIFRFDESTPFPSFWTLLPVAGSALVIRYASKATLVGRVLSNKAFVGVGLISYSLYLWHQPLFAFSRIRLYNGVSDTTYLALIAVSFALSYLTWRFVETPVRKGLLLSRAYLFSAAIAASLVLMAAGGAEFLTGGMVPPRPTALSLSQRIQENPGLGAQCINGTTVTQSCRTSDDPEIVVWGDSFAMHLVDAILASNPHAKLIQMTKTLCGPIVGMAPILDRTYSAAWASDCIAFNDDVLRWAEQHQSVRYVVMSSIFNQVRRKRRGARAVERRHEVDP